MDYAELNYKLKIKDSRFLCELHGKTNYFFKK